MSQYKRYENYKDSGVVWIEKIPREWTNSKIKYIKSNQRNSFVDGPFGSNLKSEHFVEDGEVYVIESNFATRGKIDTNTLKKITFEHYATIRRSEVNEGDIVIAKIGEYFGLNNILPQVDKPAVVSGNSLKLTVNEFIVNRKYIHYQLLLLKRIGTIDLTVNLTAQPALSLGSMNSIEVIIPPLKVQEDIAWFLTHKTTEIDSLIDDKERLIELLQEKRQAIISEAVTKGLNPNVKMKDSEIEWIGKIPEHWEVKKLKYLAKINPNKSEIKNISLDTVVTFISMEKILCTGEIDYSLTNTAENLIGGYTYFADDDIIMAKVTPCFENGNLGIVKELKNGIGFGTTELHVLRSLGDVSNRFLYYLLQTNKFKLQAVSEMYGVAGLKRIPTEFISNYKIGIPRYEEQEIIASCIDCKVTQIKTLIDDTKLQINKLKEYRQSLISEAVTGKIDVRNCTTN